MQDQYRLDGEDRVLQKTPFGFDVSVWEFFWTLSNGARLILARPEGHRDPEYLRQVIEGQGVTRLHFVPSMLQSFLERHPAGSCGSVKQVVCSGEELSAGLLQRCVKALPQAQVSNLYGPTEAAIDVSYWECRPGEELSCVPIGRPIANTQLYILDGQMKPVPIGVAGEIYIGGAGVGRGYWKRPELTAERFVKDPFSANRESRLYRTGDIGRYRLDGNIEYLARNDHQVKIRGYRIELGEIEARLKDREEIKDVVVLAREDTPGEKRLVAYYTTRMEGDVSETESLRVHLEQVLPSYMIPAAYVPLERLPLTPNGKLDRKALPAPEAGAYRHREYEAPQGEIETALAEIWGKLLLVERVGRHDNFFELGGHSLLAVRLQRELYVLGYEVSLTSIFEHPTVVKLERHIAQLERHMLQRPGNRGASENLVVLRDEGSETPLFLIHEGEGNVACLVHLAKRLDSEIPVYGLELTDPRYAASIESLAAYHIENMREIQPKGPYRIAGYSFGGLVAYEMARQLLGAGQAVTFIGLLDTVPPDETFDPMERLERMAEWRLKAKDDKAHLLKMDIGQACATAHHSYRVEPLYVPITLFEATQSVVATEGEDVRKERSRTWTAWLGSDLHIYQVSGNHLSMVKEPDVDSLAVAVSTAVRQSTG
jgi:arthrofactin-type cyclic lipopeptide synthetase C